MKKFFIVLLVLLALLAIAIFIGIHYAYNTKIVKDILEVLPFSRLYYINKKIQYVPNDVYEVYQNLNRFESGQPVLLEYVDKSSFSELEITKPIADAIKNDEGVFVSLDALNQYNNRRTYIKLKETTSFL